MTNFNMTTVELGFVGTTETTGTVGSFVVDSELRIETLYKGMKNHF